MSEEHNHEMVIKIRIWSILNFGGRGGLGNRGERWGWGHVGCCDRVRCLEFWVRDGLVAIDEKILLVKFCSKPSSVTCARRWLEGRSLCGTTHLVVWVRGTIR